MKDRMAPAPCASSPVIENHSENSSFQSKNEQASIITPGKKLNLIYFDLIFCNDFCHDSNRPIHNSIDRPILTDSSIIFISHFISNHEYW